MVYTLPTTLFALEGLYIITTVLDTSLLYLAPAAHTHGACEMRQDKFDAWYAQFQRLAGVPHPSEQLDQYRLARARYYQLEAIVIRLQPLLHRRQYVLRSSHPSIN